MKFAYALPVSIVVHPRISYALAHTCTFSMSADLSEAIDVFCEWKSDIHAAAEDDDEEAGGGDTAGSSLKDNDDGLDDD